MTTTAIVDADVANLRSTREVVVETVVDLSLMKTASIVDVDMDVEEDGTISPSIIHEEVEVITISTMKLR
jgi:hypothetical protein